MENNILGLRTTIYKVSDIIVARDWYTKAFGTAPYFDEPFYVGFNICGYELGLQPSDSIAEKTESVVSYWGVEDIDKVYQNFLELGATAHEAPTNRGGELSTAEVKDPFGNIIGLIFNPYFSLKD